MAFRRPCSAHESTNDAAARYPDQWNALAIHDLDRGIPVFIHAFPVRRRGLAKLSRHCLQRSSRLWPADGQRHRGDELPGPDAQPQKRLHRVSAGPARSSEQAPPGDGATQLAAGLLAGTDVAVGVTHPSILPRR